jgi:hypothetical protein
VNHANNIFAIIPKVVLRITFGEKGLVNKRKKILQQRNNRIETVPKHQKCSLAEGFGFSDAVKLRMAIIPVLTQSHAVTAHSCATRLNAGVCVI